MCKNNMFIPPSTHCTTVGWAKTLRATSPPCLPIKELLSPSYSSALQSHSCSKDRHLLSCSDMHLHDRLQSGNDKLQIKEWTWPHSCLLRKGIETPSMCLSVYTHVHTDVHMQCRKCHIPLSTGVQYKETDLLEKRATQSRIPQTIK